MRLIAILGFSLAFSAFADMKTTCSNIGLNGISKVEILFDQAQEKVLVTEYDEHNYEINHEFMLSSFYEAKIMLKSYKNDIRQLKVRSNGVQIFNNNYFEPKGDVLDLSCTFENL